MSTLCDYLEVFLNKFNYDVKKISKGNLYVCIIRHRGGSTQSIELTRTRFGKVYINNVGLPENTTVIVRDSFSRISYHKVIHGEENVVIPLKGEVLVIEKIESKSREVVITYEA